VPSIKRILRTSELNCSICCQSAKPWCVTQQLAHKTLKAIFPQHFADDSTKIYCKADLMALLEHALPRPPFKCDDARALNLTVRRFGRSSRRCASQGPSLPGWLFPKKGLKLYSAAVAATYVYIYIYIYIYVEESGRLERRGDELLKNVVGLTDAQLQNNRDEAILHEAIGHHVWLQPETQHWIPSRSCMWEGQQI
jgi:hypothetical protein